MRVVYNNVVLERVLTTKWEETIRYDETGINSLGSLARITFEAYVFPDPSDKFFEEAYSPSVATQTVNVGHQQVYRAPVNSKIKKILRELEIPRRSLIIYDDVLGTPIYEAYPESISVEEVDGSYQNISSSQAQDISHQLRCMDTNNGPKPLSVAVLVSCREYHKIRFEIEVAKVRCFAGETEKNNEDPDIPATDIATGIIVSNRCWTNETIDDNFYTTRVFSGKLTVSRNINTSVHSFRDCYYPPLEAGFRRESVRFSESQDGLSLSYVITDKQIRNAAPYPVTQFSGRLDYSFEYTVEKVTMQLTVVGSPFAHRPTLLGIARATLGNKLQDMQKDYNSIIPIRFDISENIGDPPSFSLTLSVMIYDATKSMGVTSEAEGGGMRFGDSGVTVGGTGSGDSEGSGEGSSAGDGASEKRDSNAISSFITEEGRRITITKKVSSVLPTKEETGTTTSSTETGEAATGDSKSSPLASIGKLAAYDVMAKEISLYFPEAVSDDYNKWTYNRELSQVPNPFGYNVLEVVNSEGKDIANHDENTRASFQFIKSMASVPCAIPPMTRITGDPVEGEKASYQTVVVRQSNVALVDPETSGMTQAALDYPYTLYKSHATYVTESHRVFKSSFLQNRLMDFTIYYPEPIILDVAAPTGKLFITIEAERQNAVPELPDPEEIVTVYSTGETEGGLSAADAGTNGTPVEDTEQYLRTAPSVKASSNTKIKAYADGRRTESPITFICLNNSVQIAEPKPAINGESTLYTLLATYEYAMSRPLRKGDEVRLLLNPILTQATCYYPKEADKDGNPVPKRDKLLTLYNGNVLNHYSPAATSSGGGSGEGGDEPSDPETPTDSGTTTP